MIVGINDNLSSKSACLVLCVRRHMRGTTEVHEDQACVVRGPFGARRDWEFVFRWNLARGKSRFNHIR